MNPATLPLYSTLMVLKVWSLNQQLRHHPGTSEKCKFSGPTQSHWFRNSEVGPSDRFILFCLTNLPDNFDACWNSENTSFHCFSNFSVDRNHLGILWKGRIWFSWSKMELQILLFQQGPRWRRHYWSTHQTEQQSSGLQWSPCNFPSIPTIPRSMFLCVLFPLPSLVFFSSFPHLLYPSNNSLHLSKVNIKSPCTQKTSLTPTSK